MKRLETIQIVGGGLAGLTLGISLRQQGTPVMIWEAGHYPRHRVCGEVLSGRGYGVLDRLRLVPALLEAGARPARTAAFFIGHTTISSFDLPAPALCIARHTLDDLLAKRFRGLGGQISEGQRWQERTIPAGVVRASGRPVQPTEGGWRWFGIKAHCENVSLIADIEMHLAKSGYAGLCRLADGRVNVCGLFRGRRGGSAGPGGLLERLRGPAGSALYERLKAARWDSASWCAVAGLALRPRQARECPECRVGDALTMIPPVTGNGMSMALESAELCSPSLAAFSRGELDWDTALETMAEACDTRFSRRLRVAGWMHRCLFHAVGRAGLMLAGRSSKLWKSAFELTR